MDWRLTSPGLAYNRDEGAAVYFHPASGDTHLVSSLAASLLALLASGVHTEEELECCLGGAEDFGPESPDRARIIDDTLQQLYTIHLIEPV